MSGRRFLTKRRVQKFIEELSEGTMFSVLFERSDGTLRTMTCRQGVTSKLKGGESTYDSNPDNIGVYDINVENEDGTKGGYRCFNATRVVRLRGAGEEVVASDAPLDEPIHDAKGRVVNQEALTS